MKYPKTERGDEELDTRYHLTPDEERAWKRLRNEPRTREDWAELQELITTWRRRFVARHSQSSTAGAVRA